MYKSYESRRMQRRLSSEAGAVKEGMCSGKWVIRRCEGDVMGGVGERPIGLDYCCFDGVSQTSCLEKRAWGR